MGGLGVNRKHKIGAGKREAREKNFKTWEKKEGGGGGRNKIFDMEFGMNYVYMIC